MVEGGESFLHSNLCSQLVMLFCTEMYLLCNVLGCRRDADETTERVPDYTFSTEKLTKLGLTFQPFEDVIYEAVASFRDRKLLA